MDVQNYKYRGVGLTGTALRSAHQKFDEYREHYHLTQYSDLLLLEELVYNEYLSDELKKKIVKLEEKNKKEDKEYSAPKYLLDSMRSLQEQSIILREKLGMFEDKNNKDGFDYIQKLKEKFAIWEKENQDREYVCGHCSKINLLRMKSEYWESQKHPFYESKVLGNKKLWQLHREGKITIQDICEILDCAPAYIEWLSKKVYNASDRKDN